MHERHPFLPFKTSLSVIVPVRSMFVFAELMPGFKAIINRVPIMSRERDIYIFSLLWLLLILVYFYCRIYLYRIIVSIQIRPHLLSQGKLAIILADFINCRKSGLLRRGTVGPSFLGVSGFHFL